MVVKPPISMRGPSRMPGIDGVADGAQLLRTSRPRLRVHAEIAQRGEAHVEDSSAHGTAPYICCSSGRDFPLRDAVIVERHAVEHHRVDVEVHHAGDQRAAAAIEHVGALRES